MRASRRGPSSPDAFWIPSLVYYVRHSRVSSAQWSDDLYQGDLLADNRFTAVYGPRALFVYERREESSEFYAS